MRQYSNEIKSKVITSSHVPNKTRKHSKNS